MVSPPLVLASASPRRKELLEQIDLMFEVLPVFVDESFHGGSAGAFACATSARKAEAASRCRPDAVVIAADTVVVLQDENLGVERVLGKPGDPDEARQVLADLSGREHRVISGVTVRWKDKVKTEAQETRVWFRTLSSDEISKYVATGEPLDKAGSYGIQGKGILLVDRLEGCYTNVVGLPLGLLRKLFYHLNLNWP